MTRTEAINLMKAGKKLSHRYFSPDEWVTINKKNNYQLEDGVECSRLMFWIDRGGVEWETGWELFIEKSMKTGIELIKEERQRQIDVEGWSKDHDKGHAKGVLGRAGSCYEVAANEKTVMPHNWPWSEKWWKPKDRIRNLVRAGALYLAESEKGYADNDKIRGGHWDARATQVANEIDMVIKETKN